MASLQTRAGGPLPKPKPGGHSFLTTPGQDIERARADAPWSTSARKTRCCGTCPHDLRLTWSYRTAPGSSRSSAGSRQAQLPQALPAARSAYFRSHYSSARSEILVCKWARNMPALAPVTGPVALKRCGSTTFSASLTQIPWHHPLALRPQHLQIPQRPRE